MSEEDTVIDPKSELYYKLLDLVNKQGKKGLDDLEKDLSILAEEDKDNWNSLVTWDIPDKYEVMRQDSIPGGLKSKYPHSQLLQRTTSKFDAVRFYDYNQYLAELVLLAQIVDEDFQKSVQSIFSIDKSTNIGLIKHMDSDDEKTIKDSTNMIKYMRGPTKLIQRARAKAANDYFDCKYPTSACVLDLNRCCLVFKDIKTMLAAIKLFENKIHHYQSGNIIDIVRDKNGFVDYVRDGVQYADIKLNVLIRGETNNIIGEVQFLLARMKEFKDTAHNLYAIQREEEFVSGAVKNVLPNLMNLEKQTNIAVLNGDVKGITSVMVHGNKSTDDIICVDKEKNQSILQRVCISGSIKVFRYMQSLMTSQQLIDRIFLSSGVYNQTPLEEAIQLGNHKLAEYILSLSSVQNKLRQKDENHDQIIWRLFFWICQADNDAMTMYINQLDSMGNTPDEIAKYFEFRYPKSTQTFLSTGAWQYWKYTILYNLFLNKCIDQVRKLTSIFGEKTIYDGIMFTNTNNLNGIDGAIRSEDIDTVKYLLSFTSLKKVCLEDQKTRWRIIFWTLREGDAELLQFILKELQFTKESLNSIFSEIYPQPTTTEKQYLINWHWEYWNENAIHEIFNNKHYINICQALLSVVGASVVSQQILRFDGVNHNVISLAITRDNVNEVKYIFDTFPSIKEECIKNIDMRWIIVYFMDKKYEECPNVREYFMKELNFTKESLTELVSYKYPKPNDTSYLGSDHVKFIYLSKCICAYFTFM